MSHIDIFEKNYNMLISVVQLYYDKGTKGGMKLAVRSFCNTLQLQKFACFYVFKFNELSIRLKVLAGRARKREQILHVVGI
jgi:hypothetical protein